MEKRKNIKIKSRLRFSIFIITLTILTITCASTLIGLNNVNGETEQNYICVQVVAGETLWELADQYKSKNMDTREAVYLIQEENNLKTADIEVGQIIKINVPIEK